MAIELPLGDVSNRKPVISDTLADKLYTAVATDRSANAVLFRMIVVTMHVFE